MQDPSFAERLKSRRVAAGLSQQALASAADLSIRTVARIEAGEDCTVGTLSQIAEVLGCSVPELLAGDDVEPEQAAAS